jgi:hypothetical protein
MTTPTPADALRDVIEALDRATPGPWNWSENGNLLGDMPNGYDESKEIAAVYTELDDDLEPTNSLAIRLSVAFLRTHADTLRRALATLAAVEAAPVVELLPRSHPFALDWIAMGDADNESNVNGLVGQRVALVRVGEG